MKRGEGRRAGGRECRGNSLSLLLSKRLHVQERGADAAVVRVTDCGKAEKRGGRERKKRAFEVPYEAKPA